MSLAAIPYLDSPGQLRGCSLVSNGKIPLRRVYFLSRYPHRLQWAISTLSMHIAAAACDYSLRWCWQLLQIKHSSGQLVSAAPNQWAVITFKTPIQALLTIRRWDVVLGTIPSHPSSWHLREPQLIHLCGYDVSSITFYTDFNLPLAHSQCHIAGQTSSLSHYVAHLDFLATVLILFVHVRLSQSSKAMATRSWL